MSERYEYCQVVEHAAQRHHFTVNAEEAPGHTAEEVFNELGRAGWRLVTGWHVAQQAQRYFYFIRVLEP